MMLSGIVDRLALPEEVWPADLHARFRRPFLCFCPSVNSGRRDLLRRSIICPHGLDAERPAVVLGQSLDESDAAALPIRPAGGAEVHAGRVAGSGAGGG